MTYITQMLRFFLIMFFAVLWNWVFYFYINQSIIDMLKYTFCVLVECAVNKCWYDNTLILMWLWVWKQIANLWDFRLPRLWLWRWVSSRMWHLEIFPDDGEVRLLWNVGTYLPHYTASQHMKHKSSKYIPTHLYSVIPHSARNHILITIPEPFKGGNCQMLKTKWWSWNYSDSTTD